MTGENLVGQKFGRWLVLEKLEPEGRKKYRYLCRCDCGTERPVIVNSLKTGRSKSCGCLASETTIKRNFKHGKSGTPEYNTWAGMKQRCYYKQHSQYYLYGGKGIKVDPFWHDFSNFLSDMGKKPGVIIVLIE